MKRKAVALAATLVAFAPVHRAASAGSAPQTAAQAIASVDYLVGTWRCAHTVGTFSGTYTTTYSKVLGDRWLRETWDFPAQGAEARITAESLMGYDEGRQSWVRFFANSLGQHFEIRISDTPNGWSYKYASFFRRATPETPEPDAVFTKKSDTEYTVDGPTYPKGATRVTEHHTCHKSLNPDAGAE
jgi:hypothetical protein